MKSRIVFAWDIATGPAHPLQYGFGSSPFGHAIVAVDEIGLCGLGFGTDEPALRAAIIGKHAPLRDDDAAGATLKAIFGANGALAVHMCGTPWQIQVWQALCAIPAGTTTTYGALARVLEAPRAARAVGTAVGRNPVAWLVPCHRVVGQGGQLTGYRWGLAVKTAMLATEGISAQT